METNQTGAQLPTLADLHYDVQAAFKNDQLNLLLNQPPHQDWLKDFPAEMGIRNGGKYMPIDKVEFMLTRIFGEWYPEVISYTQLFQSIAVHVRLHYKNPLTGEWSFKDGLGASPVQTNKDASAADLGQIKTRAVQIALPIAKTAAIKDAAEEFGTLFGRDLNRKDTVMFAGAYSNGNGQPVTAKTAAAQPEPVAKPNPTTTASTNPPVTIVEPSFESFTFNPAEL